MQLWLSRRSQASLKDQLVSQLRIALASGEVPSGERLPSVREIARRYRIHANTVSAAYQELARTGWLDHRRGSGVFASQLTGKAPDSNGSGADSLDRMVDDLLARAHREGYSTAAIRSRFARRVGHWSVRRIVVLEPEPELGEVLAAEIAEQVSLPVELIPAAQAQRTPQHGMTVALSSRVSDLTNSYSQQGAPFFILRPPTFADYLRGQSLPGPGALIGVASHSPYLLSRARLLLMATGLDGDALTIRDAREPGWKRGLKLCDFVIADRLTAAKLPTGVPSRIVPLLSQSSLRELTRLVELVREPE